MEEILLTDQSNDAQPQTVTTRPQAHPGIANLLKDARQRLVETGTRNRLVHVNRSAARANVLNIINEQSDFVFDFLRGQGKKMRFKATGKDRQSLDDNAVALFVETEPDEPFDEGRYSDNQLETPLGPDAQAKRLLRLARDAKTAEEEQGINILYLALGFLSWFEDKSSAVEREAPLILLPVELVRNAKTSNYDLVCRDDEIITNLPLQERLRGDFGIELPEVDADHEEWSPSAYFDLVKDRIEGKPEWSLDRDGMQLGFFSFAKLLMLRDLDPSNWTPGALEDNELIKGLLATGFAQEPSMFDGQEKLDQLLEPANIIQVVDADASQTKVIEEVRSGRNLVVQGPPGTGKSQTITNIIASAVHDGKSVLFVAEKMAALSVVHRRLKKAGLENICLELHSRASNKKQVIDEIGRTLVQGTSVPAMPADPDELKLTRDQLNDILEALHSPIGNSGNTVYQTLARLVSLAGQEAPIPELDGTPLTATSDSDVDEIMGQLDRYMEGLGDAPGRAAHPLFGVANLKLQPMDLQRLQSSLARLSTEFETFKSKAEKIVQLTGISDPSFVDVERTCRFLDEVLAAPDYTQQLLPIFGDAEQTEVVNSGLQLGIEWQTKLLRINKIYQDVAWDVPIEHLRGALASGTAGFFSRFKSSYRQASAELATLVVEPLPKNANERLKLFDQLLALRKARKEFVDQTASLSHLLGKNWQGEKTNFSVILKVGRWLTSIRSLASISDEALATLLGKRDLLVQLPEQFRTGSADNLQAIQAVFDSLNFDVSGVFYCDNINEIKLMALVDRIQKLQTHLINRYDSWQRLSEAAASLSSASLSKILEGLDEGKISSAEAKVEIRYARAEALWRLAREQYPQLDGIVRSKRHEVVSRFTKLEKQRIEDVQTLIRAKHLDQLPRGSIGEMGVIQSEMGKRRRLKPVRKLISQAGSMIQRIKPVLLMSPISIAQFLPPETLEFDLLVIDEASQVRPEDALGAIARAKQIVVVGDTKQLPPTSFFDRMTGNDEEKDEDDEGAELLEGAARATELESILTLCEARSISSRMLEWHYRSRDPSLMRVSNKEFYNDNLVLPPSPLEHDDTYGMKFTKVDGAYTSASKGTGTPGTNKIEAQAIVDEVSAHARLTPDFSLGIVTFSVRQRNMVTELLELARRSDATLDAFLREGRSEDLFVKNIENVQGDERDVILVSVGYGPHEPRGRLSTMSFGPVNGEGGERRLNVLFSRARIRCEIFASFDPGDIDLSRTQKEGPRIFKRYLEYAKSGVLDQPVSTGLAADSEFEIDVANEIRKLGFVVDYQVGSAGFLIDLGVKHPVRTGQYMLAVECDGATYHSALWARERDRLRQDVLENLGWQFHRIWSTDWFQKRADEIERLKNVLRNASELTNSGVEITGANSGDEFLGAADKLNEHDSNPEVIEVKKLPLLECPAYERANFSVSSALEPHETPKSQLTEIVRRIVEVEGPVHQEEIARRLAGLFGKERAGNRIFELTKDALSRAKSVTKTPMIVKQGPFWATELQLQEVPLRNRKDATGTIQKAEMIPPIEIATAIHKILEESGEASEDEIVRATAKLFGFDRVGPALREVIKREVDQFPNALS